jgi:hypothetical protein
MNLLGRIITDIATNFVMFEPDNGRPISDENEQK